MRFIYMVIGEDILFTCIIYAAAVYHQSECDIPNFCMACVLLWFGKGYNHMVSSDWLKSNAYFIHLMYVFVFSSGLRA